MCLLTVVLLVFPGTNLDSLWKLNPDAHIAFQSLGSWSIVLMLVVGIGCALAGLAGALAGPMRGAYAEMGVTMVIESFVVVVVGGMGSLLGAVVAGIMMGQVVGITTFFAPKLAEIMVFVVMALVLLVRPSGFFGEAGLME